mgnify:CR=1 FL=1
MLNINDIIEEYLNEQGTPPPPAGGGDGPSMPGDPDFPSHLVGVPQEVIRGRKNPETGEWEMSDDGGQTWYDPDESDIDGDGESDGGEEASDSDSLPEDHPHYINWSNWRGPGGSRKPTTSGPPEPPPFTGGKPGEGKPFVNVDPDFPQQPPPPPPGYELGPIQPIIVERPQGSGNFILILRPAAPIGAGGAPKW